jgi:very-short-patch-repair endonuclease
MRAVGLKGMSGLEQALWIQIQAAGLPLPATEHRFSPPRRYRFDFCWVEQKVAAECEGGTWVRGAHSRGKHFESDAEKYNLAALIGYRVLRFTTDMVKDGRALATIERALKESE